LTITSYIRGDDAAMRWYTHHECTRVGVMLRHEGIVCFVLP
jgi:hypothetical protein